MRRLAVLVVALVGGCDRVLGLANTQITDAPPPPPVDAPPMCPAIGGDAPAFNGALISLDAKGCVQYSVSAATDTAMAICYEAPVNVIEQGSIGGMFVPSSFDTAPAMPSGARISPEGDLAVVLGYDGAHVVLSTYARGPDVNWSFAATIDATSTFTAAISAPSRGPDRRVLALAAWSGGTLQLVEYGDGDTGTWQIVSSIDYTVLGIQPDSLNLTEDGLRLILHDGMNNATYYTDRPSRSISFRTPIVIDTVPIGPGLYPYMSEDCGRLYFSALDRNFYIEQ